MRSKIFYLLILINLYNINCVSNKPSDKYDNINETQIIKKLKQTPTQKVHKSKQKKKKVSKAGSKKSEYFHDSERYKQPVDHKKYKPKKVLKESGQPQGAEVSEQSEPQKETKQTQEEKEKESKPLIQEEKEKESKFLIQEEKESKQTQKEKEKKSYKYMYLPPEIYDMSELIAKKTFLAVNNDGDVIQFHFKDGKIKFDFKNNISKAPLYSISLNPINKKIAAIGGKKGLYLYDSETNKVIKKILISKSKQKFITTCCFTPDGNKIIFGLNNGYIVIINSDLDLKQYKILEKKHKKALLQIKFNPKNHNIFYTLSDDGFFYEFEINNDIIKNNGEVETPYVSDFDISNDGTQAILGKRSLYNTEASIQIMYLNKHKEIISRKISNDSVYSVCYSPDNKFFSCGTAKGYIYIFTSDKSLKYKEKLHSAHITKLLFPNNNTILSCSSDGSINSYNPEEIPKSQTKEISKSEAISKSEKIPKLKTKEMPKSKKNIIDFLIKLFKK